MSKSPSNQNKGDPELTVRKKNSRAEKVVLVVARDGLCVDDLTNCASTVDISVVSSFQCHSHKADAYGEVLPEQKRKRKSSEAEILLVSVWNGPTDPYGCYGNGKHS